MSEWKQFPIHNTTTTPFEPRTGHSLAYFPFSESLYIFGGASHESGYLNELWELNYVNHSLSLIEKPKLLTSNEIGRAVWPCGRYEHGCLVDLETKKMYILGGVSEAGLLNDFWEFDIGTFYTLMLEKKVFTQISSDKGIQLPADQYKNACFLYQDKIYAYSKDSLYIYSLGKNHWIQIRIENGPSPRTGSTWTLGKDEVWVFGGMNDSHVCLNDLWKLDLKTLQWKQVSNTEEGRTGHCALFVDNKYLLIHGGAQLETKKLHSTVELFNTETGKWHTLKNKSKPRLDHDISINSQKVIVLGGMDFEHVFHDAWTLDLTLDLLLIEEPIVESTMIVNEKDQQETQKQSNK